MSHVHPYRYLIGYAIGDQGVLAAVDISRAQPIASLRDVQDVQHQLREHTGMPTLLIISFSAYTNPSRTNPPEVTG